MHSGQTEIGQQECHCVPTGLRCLSGKLKRRIGKPEQNVVRFDVKLDNVSVVQELDSRGDVIHPALDYWMGKKCIEQLAKIIMAYEHQDEHRLEREASLFVGRGDHIQVGNEVCLALTIPIRLILMDLPIV